LSHFDKQGLVCLVRGFVGQAQAFGGAPLMVLKSGHRTLPLRCNAGACGSVPCHPLCHVPCAGECGQALRAFRFSCSKSPVMRIVVGWRVA
jgi:hypothetical protein